MSDRDHVVNEEVRRKIQTANGKYNKLLTLVKKRAENKVVWLNFKIL